MNLFIATIFIAELIIAGFIISLVTKADKKVKEYNDIVLDRDKGIIPTIKEIRRVVNQGKILIVNSKAFFVKKRKEFFNKLLHLGLIYLCIVMLKTRFKKAATMLRYILLAKDLWMSIPV